MPRDFPQKYSRALKRVEIFNASMSWDAATLTAWQKRHGIAMEPEPLAIFSDYIKSGHAIFSTLVEHPPVPDPLRYARCSIVLQRAVIVVADGTEDLYLRSYFHSARDDSTYVNFVPRAGVRMTFPSEKIWFPLELTRVIQEPFSYVVLDVLTPQALDLRQVPQSFRSESKGTIAFRGRRYSVARLTARLPAKQRSPDLLLPVSLVRPEPKRPP